MGGTTYTTDQLGQPRPFGGAGGFCDAGAYEYQGTIANCVFKVGTAAPVQATNARALQTAIDNAPAGAIIKVAGACRGVAGTDPWVLRITKSLTLEGGYSTDEDETWTDPDPAQNETTLDAQSLGGVVGISGSGVNVTLRYLTITNGKRGEYAGRAGMARRRHQRGVLQGHGQSHDGQGRRARRALFNDECHRKPHQGNSATVGGAAVGGGAMTYGGVLTLKNSTVISNTGHWGGGVANWGGQLDLKFSTLGWNSGADLYVNNATVNRVAANILLGNAGHC